MLHSQLTFFALVILAVCVTIVSSESCGLDITQHGEDLQLLQVEHLLEDTPSLHLLQVDKGIRVRAAVDGSGRVVDAEPDLEAEVKPSPLAYAESETEDSGMMHLLQTSRDVMLDVKADDTLTSNINTSSSPTGANPLPALDARDESGSILILGPENARSSTVFVGAKSTPAVTDSQAARFSSAIADTTTEVLAAPVVAQSLVAAASAASVPPAQQATASNGGAAAAVASIVKGPKNSSAALATPEAAPATPKASPLAVAAPAAVKVPKETLAAAKDTSKSGSVQKHNGASQHTPKNSRPGGNFKMKWSSPLDVAVPVHGHREVQQESPTALLTLLAVAFWVVLLLLVLVGSCKLGSGCLSFYRYSEETALREHVQAMRRSPGQEVVDQLVAGSVHDCAIMRPLASRQLIRVEARVEEAASGVCLWTPLTQQACVRFNATVSRQVKGANLPVPMSYHCHHIDFVVSLLDAPHVRIEIEGRDLSTFDMSAGRMSAKRTFDSAAKHWKEFAMTYQIGGKSQPPARFRSEHAVLEFQETAIVLGTNITVIGELQRNSIGTLLLRPSVEDEKEEEPLKQESWRTSWESAGLVKDSTAWASIRSSLANSRKPWLGKVWISDDPTFLGAQHKHAKYEQGKPSRDCSSQLTDGIANLLTTGGE